MFFASMFVVPYAVRLNFWLVFFRIFQQGRFYGLFQCFPVIFYTDKDVTILVFDYLFEGFSVAV